MPNHHLTKDQKAERARLADIGQRRCTKCGAIKALDAFGIKRFFPVPSLHGQCNACRNQRRREIREPVTSPVAEARREQVALRQRGLSKCTGVCGAVLPVSAFHSYTSKAGILYVSAMCKVCKAALMRGLKYDRPRSLALRENKRLAPLGLRFCPKCQSAAPIRGRSSYCANCESVRESERNLNEEHRQRRKAYFKSYKNMLRARKLDVGLAQLRALAQQQQQHEK